MCKIAFVFSGQGSQHALMGKDFYDNFLVAKEVFEQGKTVRENILDICFNDSDNSINDTLNAQLCLYITEYAIYKVLRQKNVKESALAGFSLGEITALTTSGAFSFLDGLKIVDIRSRLMSDETKKINTCMFAVLKLNNEKVIEFCKTYKDTYPVNFNCSGQVVISTLLENAESIEQNIKTIGGRAVKLNVSGGFHCKFMEKASEEICSKIENLQYKNINTPLYANETGKLYEGNIVKNIANHIKKPVLWEQTILNMTNDGIDTFVEIGAGKTLSSFIKKINKNVKVLNVEDIESLNKTLSSLGVNS